MIRIINTNELEIKDVFAREEEKANVEAIVSEII